ncbi:hypothetical protein ACFV24_02975 [Nocardia fluminea]
MTLMSTHLAEALHDLDREKRPCVVIVGDTGLATILIESGA